jgi:ATP/maltotriose-dependent transcriptional regulator MalT
MSIYPEALQELSDACTRYREHSSSLDEVQAAVWKAVETIVAFEERELRAFLQVADGQLDQVRFTTDEQRVFEESLRIVSQIEAEIGKW